MSKNELAVRLCEKPIGTLFRIGGTMSFTYDDNAKRSLSLSMSLSKSKYGNRICEAFFGGLLPESQKARTIIGRLFDIQGRNSFNLLAAIGYDCAGAVSLQSVNAPANPSDTYRFECDALTDKKLADYLQQLPARPLLAHLGELRISLAGVQDKAALCLIDEKIGIPIGNSPSTHIIKPAIALLPESVHNEYFCLKLAEALGLPTAKIEIRKAKNIIYLLIKRYDRLFISADKIKRIHQEDFCQASGVVSSSKYQSDGGPSLKNCFDLLMNASSPALARKHFLDLVIFNYLVGNADAHAKNFAFLYPESATIQLAPAYDILCTRIYEQTTSKMAMSIGGEYLFEQVRSSHWQKFCDQNKLSYSGFKQRCGEIVEDINKLTRIGENNIIELGYKSKIVPQICDYIEKSSLYLSKQLA